MSWNYDQYNSIIIDIIVGNPSRFKGKTVTNEESEAWKNFNIRQNTYHGFLMFSKKSCGRAFIDELINYMQNSPSAIESIELFDTVADPIYKLQPYFYHRDDKTRLSLFGDTFPEQ